VEVVEVDVRDQDHVDAAQDLFGEHDVASEMGDAAREQRIREQAHAVDIE
jgi:hypothetical protein